jgi:hypothetical protein
MFLAYGRGDCLPTIAGRVRRKDPPEISVAEDAPAISILGTAFGMDGPEGKGGKEILGFRHQNGFGPVLLLEVP